jgi:integrase
MSSLYRKPYYKDGKKVKQHSGVFYYQRYLVDEHGDRVRKQICLHTKNESGALQQQEDWDRYFDERESNAYSSVLIPKVPFEKRVEEYLSLRKLQVEQGDRADATFKVDRSVLSAFSKFLTTHYKKKLRMSQIKREHVEAFISDLRTRGHSRKEKHSPLSSNTILAYVRHLKSFFSFCNRKGWIAKHPAENLESLPTSRRRESYPTLLTKKGVREWQKLYDHVQKRVNPKKKSTDFDWFGHWMWIMMNTGMRSGEVQLLRWSRPVNYRTMNSYCYLEEQSDGEFVIHIRFKRGKRTIPVPPQIDFKKIPKEITTKDKTIKKRFLFANPYTGDPYLVSAVSKKFKKLMQELKLPLDYTPHSLRHGFVTLKLSEGHSVWVVGRQVGHSTEQMTQLYGHTETETLKTLFEKLE